MRNRFVLMMSLLALFGTLCSCSNDDGGFTANYHVLDENGQDASTFNDGDAIILELIVTNSTSQTLKKEELELLNGAFILYNSDGQKFNPITYSNFMMHYVTIGPNEQFCRQLIWPWDIVPLPKGKYYSTYTLNIDNINKMYTINFEIK